MSALSNRRVIPFLSLALLLGVASDRATSQDADVQKLQGVWRGHVVNGRGENPDQGPVHLELTIKGNTIVARNLNPGAEPALGEGTYRLALDGETRTIDATRSSNPGQGKVYVGIYTFDGETFKWCVSPRKERPTDFVTRKGQFLLVLKRTKS